MRGKAMARPGTGAWPHGSDWLCGKPRIRFLEGSPMSPRITTPTAHGNVVVRRLLSSVLPNVLLGIGTEVLLSLLGVPPWPRIAVEVVTLTAVRWRIPW